MTATKRDMLTELSFGHRIAEEEVDELARYFVETDQWRRIYDGSVDIVYGPKGSGKSALYALLQARKAELQAKGVVLTSGENPQGTPIFKDLAIDPPTSEREFIGLWKVYLLLLVGRLLKEENPTGEHARKVLSHLEAAKLMKAGTLRSVLSAAFGYVRRISRPEAIEGGVKVDPHSGLPTGFTGKVVFANPESAEGSDGSGTSIDDLFDSADQALRGMNRIVWILLDRLDVAFAEAPELEENALRALFKVYLDLLTYKNIRLKIFLRTDIWGRIADQGFREASHITRSVTIEWTPQSMLNLAVRRAIQKQAVLDYYGVSAERVLQTSASQEEFFYRLFPPQVDVGKNRPDTFNWIVGRITDGAGRFAPRELIHLLNRARDVQLRMVEVGEPEPEGASLFSRMAVRNALEEVSKVRIEQTLYAEYPTLKRYIEALQGKRRRIRRPLPLRRSGGFQRLRRPEWARNSLMSAFSQDAARRKRRSTGPRICTARASGWFKVARTNCSLS